MRQLASFFGKLVVSISSYTICCWSISQPGINYLLSSKIATVMGSRFHVPDVVSSFRLSMRVLYKQNQALNVS